MVPPVCRDWSSALHLRGVSNHNCHRPHATTYTAKIAFVTLPIFNGGMGLCGPQFSGLSLGRKNPIEAAKLNSAPWEGAVCRAVKAGKEETWGAWRRSKPWMKMDVGEDFHVH